MTDVKDDTIAKLTADNAALRDFAASPPIWWSVVADGAIIHAELEGCSAIAKFADSSLRLVRADGEVLADLIVRARSETEKPQAAIEEIGAALLWSHRRSLRLDTVASPDPGAGWVSPEEHARVAAESENLRIDAEAYRARGYYDLAGERDEARARLAEVEEQNREWKEDAAKVLADKCAKDERHCVCVVHLRAELARVKAEAEGLRALWVRVVDWAETHNAVINKNDAIAAVVRTARAALASPTPAQGDEVGTGQKTAVWTSR